MKQQEDKPRLINIPMIEKLFDENSDDIGSIKEWLKFPLTKVKSYEQKTHYFYNDARRYSLDEINRRCRLINQFHYIDVDDQSAIEFELHDNRRQAVYITTFQDMSCIQEVFHTDKKTSTIYC